MDNVDYDKFSEKALKNRLNTLTNNLAKYDKIFNKVKQVYNSAYYRRKDNNTPRYLFKSRQTGNLLKRQNTIQTQLNYKHLIGVSVMK